MAKKPVMLMILDGFGIAPKGDGNAVEAAKKEKENRAFFPFGFMVK